MANDHLKTALTGAGLTVEEFADIIRVDPKTVQRWVAGRTPYARHRGTVSRALNIPEHELWPDSVPAPAAIAVPQDRPTPAVAGIGLWAHMYDDGAPNPIVLLTDLYEEVDLLDPTGALLSEPGVVAALQSLITRGCSVRVLSAGLVAGQSWPPVFQQIGLRTVHKLAANHVILRADDMLLLALPLSDERSPPLFVLDRSQAEQVFDRFAAHIDHLWDTATVIDRSAEPTAVADANRTADPSAASEPPRRWPHQPT